MIIDSSLVTLIKKLKIKEMIEKMNLNKQKLEKMIQEYLKIESPTPDEVRQFKTLTKAHESAEKQVPEPIILKPPKIFNIPHVKNIFVIQKDANMGNCISEMLTNPLFIQMREICEVA